MNLHNKYKDFEKRIKFNENVVKDDNQTLVDLSNSLDSLTASQQTQDTAIENHSNILNTHSQLIDSLTQSFYGDSVEEFDNIDNLCILEPLYYYGGRAKFNGGTKASNGPFGYIYTRVTPGTRFSGVIRLYLSSMPELCTSANIRFHINDDFEFYTYEAITDKEYQFEISFDIFAYNASNVFRIVFSDINFREIVLDSIEIITENGRNFMCLNRLDYFSFSSFNAPSGITKFVYTSQLSNVGKYAVESSIVLNPNFSEVLQLPGDGTPVDTNIIRNQVKISVGLRYYTTTNMQISIAAEGSTLYRTSTTSGSYTKVLDGVYFAFMGYHWRNGSLCYCGTLLNQQVFIGTSSVKATDIPTINSIALPSQFVTCTPVEDWEILSRTAYKEIGYILLHNSGKIFYIPKDDGTYFIEIGFGNQPNAYMQPDYETIHVYYHFNNVTYRKTLKLNTETNKWELAKTFKTYPGVIEIFEPYENFLVQVLMDGTRRTVFA